MVAGFPAASAHARLCAEVQSLHRIPSEFTAGLRDLSAVQDSGAEYASAPDLDHEVCFPSIPL